MIAMTRTRKPRSTARSANRHLDTAGAALLGVTIAAMLAALILIAAPNASADRHDKDPANTDVKTPDAKFKGHLPITELTEDQAILHALNRLAYGPRPGDVERIRQMGLEKWIDQQLHPESISDAALDERLERYPTLNMAARKLLVDYPQPNQAAKKEGITKEEYEQQMKDKQREAESQIIVTGNENLDKAQLQLAKLQGPGRIVAEL